MKAESRQIPQKLAARLKFACWLDIGVSMELCISNTSNTSLSY